MLSSHLAELYELARASFRPTEAGDSNGVGERKSVLSVRRFQDRLERKRAKVDQKPADDDTSQSQNAPHLRAFICVGGQQ